MTFLTFFLLGLFRESASAGLLLIALLENWNFPKLLVCFLRHFLFLFLLLFGTMLPISFSAILVGYGPFHISREWIRGTTSRGMGKSVGLGCLPSDSFSEPRSCLSGDSEVVWASYGPNYNRHCRHRTVWSTLQIVTLYSRFPSQLSLRGLTDLNWKRGLFSSSSRCSKLWE